MPLRQDPSLWWNLPGIVAAYQPVRAPDSLLARYNMRMGGTSAFRAEPGVLPAWNGATGWRYNGTTQYLKTGIVLTNNQTWSALVCYTNAGTENSGNLFGAYSADNNAFLIRPRANLQYFNGAKLQIIGDLPSGVMGFAGNRGYRNGIVETGTMLVPSGTNTLDIYIGCLNFLGIQSIQFLSSDTKSLSFFNRTLTPAEMWLASRQMQYCDVNPDWSVWSPRRKWFPYVLAGTAAGRVGIYGARPTVALPGGVRIVPQDEGGING